MFSDLAVVPREGMMKDKRRIVFLTTILFGIVMLVDAISWYMFPEIRFVDGNLNIAGRVLVLFSFSSFIFGLLLLFKVNRVAAILAALLLFSVFFINSCAEIYPIETLTEPVDIGVLREENNGTKWVVRKYENAKTHQDIQDTVLVKDFFIFREIIKSPK